MTWLIRNWLSLLLVWCSFSFISALSVAWVIREGRWWR